MGVQAYRALFIDTGKRIDLPREKRLALAVLSKCGPTVRAAIVATAAYFDIEPWLIVTRRRLQSTYRYRAVAMAIVRSRSSLSLDNIGDRFGNYHHTTVLHAIRRADRDAVAAVSLLLDETRAP